MNISSESAFGQGGSSASSAIDGEDSIFDRGLTDFMDGSPAGRQMLTYRTFDRSSTFTHNVHFALCKYYVDSTLLFVKYLALKIEIR